MRLFCFVGLLAAFALGSCGKPEPTGPDPQVESGPPPFPADLPVEARQAAEKARQAVQSLAGNLRARLESEIARGGAVGAIEVCRAEATVLAATESEKVSGVVRRTTLRTRNHDNEPDDHEIAAMEKFGVLLKAGTSPQRLEQVSVAAEGGRRWLRYERAIVAEAACLTCHGETIAPPIRAKLEATYPDDRATGYREGDLRGIFSVRIPLDSVESQDSAERSERSGG